MTLIPGIRFPTNREEPPTVASGIVVTVTTQLTLFTGSRAAKLFVQRLFLVRVGPLPGS